MSVSDRLAAWKNRLIADPAFQAFAVSNPLTRPVANRKAAESFDLVAGFVYSQILAAAVETGLIRRACEGAFSAEEFSEASGLGVPGSERLMLAAASLKLLRRQSDGRFAIGEMGAALLGNPSVFAMIRHHQVLYRDLEDIMGRLRLRTAETELGQFWAYRAEAEPDSAGAYSALMAETQALIGAEVIRVARMGRSKCLMDVGGGAGAFLERAGTRFPHLALRLADLPQVVVQARQRFKGSPLEERLETFGLDFHAAPLPHGADLITLIRVLHDHDDEPAERLLRNIRAALAPSGRLVLAEPMANARGAARMGDAYFGMYLWAMGRGRPRTSDEITAMLRRAGFTKIVTRRTRAPLLTCAIEAR
ncbi:MAG: methyltransferase [Hyphomonas sp.]|uniref:methyltransferase n=1 Tax=Hyphomonas sp. TaxID=87 RepID=UPI001DD3AE4C|nr:methyltransferase [Hyphomonas sp.]MBA4225964.1 methyltransferase [Hyphomonas sp.]